MHSISKKNSLSDGFLKQRASFIKGWRIEWSLLLFWTKKTVKVKHIESYKPKERYQVDTVLLSNMYEMNLNIFLQCWIISQIINR